MAEKAGGRAGKAGDWYEHLWVVKQALLVLGGERESICWEAIGDDERGVDVWVAHTDGTREAHQCKRQNGTKSKWTIKDLARNGALVAAKAQLSRDDNHRYVLVSADPATELRELTERARTCNNSIQNFLVHMLDTKLRKAAFGYLCDQWELDPAQPDDGSLALNWLQRMEYEHFDMEVASRPQVERLARALVQGDPPHVVSTIGVFLAKNLGNDIYADLLLRQLQENGFRLLDLSSEPKLPVAVNRLKARFLGALEHLLIDGSVLSRPEVAGLVSMIKDDNGPRLIWVHGNAGSGKSGALYELVQHLDRDKVPCLPLRLDRLVPARSPHHYGREVCDLPASPAGSLSALAGRRKSVLILDQIDAVRWSGAHTSHAWEVCKEVVAEALDSPNMRVVVALRTFDLQDREVQHWKQRQVGPPDRRLKSATCAVGELPEAEVARVLSRRNVPLKAMTPRQRSLMRTPLGLYLWCAVHKDGSSGGRTFSTFTSLMREFWNDRWKRLESMRVPPEDVQAVLDTLTQYMDRVGTLRAPTKILSPRYSQALAALFSLHILTQDSTSVSFAHQSYADYLIALGVQQEALEGGKQPIEWVQAHDQSLFRRGQLRQLLTLLRDAEPALYIKTVRDLLLGEGVRFHFRYLALRLLGTWDEALDDEVSLLVTLYSQPKWQGHVLREILWVSAAFFLAFHERGVFQAQLASGEDSQINVALYTIRGMGTRFGGIIDRLLDPYWSAKDPWPTRIGYVIAHSIEEDTDRMFEFRLAQTQACARHEFTHFSEAWAVAMPTRCLRLTRAHAKAYIGKCRQFVGAKDGKEPPQWARVTKGLEKAISAACRAAPLSAWKFLAPCVEALGRLRRTRRRGDYTFRRGMSQAAASLRRWTIVAGQTLASSRPDKFVQFASPYLKTRSLTMRRVLLASVAHGGRRLADVGLGWLCDLPEFLGAGPRRYAGSPYGASRWAPASYVIRRLSKVCSDDMYQRLERLILGYREADELESCRAKLRQARAGYDIWPNRVGLAQNALLAALPPDRMSPQARALAGVWRQKFGPPVFPKKEVMRFRPVVSPVPRDRLHAISDRQWLKTIARSWPQERRRVENGKGAAVLEASPERFAADLGEMAKREPRRFAKLALLIPPSAGAVYLGRILSNLIAPGSPRSDSRSAAPAPPTRKQLRLLLEHVGYSEDYGVATGFCDIVGADPGAMWPDIVLDQLERYATEHPDPGPENTKRELVMTEWNCVRGRAAHAMGALLMKKPVKWKRFIPTIEKLVRDAHLAVRLAAIGVCGALLKSDRALAIKLFLEACADDECRVAAERSAQHFIRYVCRKHWPEIVPLIQRMVDSGYDEAVEHGVSWMVVTSLEAGFGASALSLYLGGSRAHRKGCAAVAVEFARTDSTEAACQEILTHLFDDESEDVRKEASSVFHHHDLYARPGFEVFAEKYSRSRAFLDDPWILLHGLAAYPGRLSRFSNVILDVCDVIGGDRVEHNLRVRGHDVDDLASVLLRLYEQSQDGGDRPTQTKCLDAWDGLLERGLGGVREQLAELDS